MIRITGQTFPHRETLKAWGARWNGEYKTWELAHLDDAQRAIIRKWPGVMVSDEKPQPKPFKLAEPKYDIDAIYEALTRAPTEPPPSKRDGRTNVFGNDQTYLNYFADQNPISFFGFDSLSAMVKFIDKLDPGTMTHTQKRGYHRDMDDWFGSESMTETLNLARNGWPEGVEMAQEIAQQLAGDNALERRRIHSMTGGSVNVGRMLSGNPMHMRSRPKQPGKKIVTFFVEGFASSVVDIESMITRAAVTAAVADVLETNGYSCNIVSVTTSRTRNKEPAYHVVTTLKAAGETLNLNDIVFALGHPSYFRRMVFAVNASDPALREVWPYMGFPSKAFDEMKQNEYYVKQIHYSKYKPLDDAPLLTKAMQIWDLIVSDDLPITLNREDD